VTDPAAYVVKPFHERELRAVLEIALYRAQINEERKQAAAALQESEQRFRQLAESTPQAFWMFDCATRQVIYCSPAYEKIWKRPVATLLSRYEEWTDSLHPADRDAVLAWRARIAEPGGAEECEYRILRPDGIVRWISDRAFAIRDAQGRVSRIAGVAEDITARKLAEEQLRASRTELEERIETSAAELKAVNERLQAEIEEHRQTVAALRASEERYRMLFEAAADVIFTASPDGLITSLNPAFEKITGWPRSRFIGASYRSLIHPEDLPRSDELLRRAAAGEQTPIHTLRIVSQSGQILVGEFNETVLVQDGKVVGLLGIARNITHRDPTPAVAP
jgi:PAS domain S-box-containing protein